MDETTIRSHLVASLARRLRRQPDTIGESVALTRYGLDSLEATEVMAEMEQLLGVEIPDDLPFEHPTVAELVGALAALAADAATP